MRVPAWLGSGEGHLLGYRVQTSRFIFMWQKEKELLSGLLEGH